MLLRGSKSVAFVFTALGLSVAVWQPSPARADELCDTLKKILADRDDSYKNISKPDGSTSVKMPGATKCERDEDDYFTCDFLSLSDKKAAEKMHASLDKNIAACYASAKRTVEKKDDGGKSISYEIGDDGPRIIAVMSRAIDTYFVYVWVDSEDFF